MVTGTLMVTPYMIDYDMALLAAPIAWLTCEGLRNGFLPYEKSILFLAWIFPLFARVAITIRRSTANPDSSHHSYARYPSARLDHL